ncbi:MAG: TMEM175 family protein [Candidatus Binataceae bacterium]
MSETPPDGRPPQGLTTARVTALVDGVFAIVLTLLVLDLHAPTATSRAELAARLRDLAPSMVAYLVSFVVLGIFWYGHHMEMHWIVRSDRVHLGITLAFLLTISFVPFSAALLGQNQRLPLASAVYAANMCAVGAMRYIHWIYATHGFRLTAPDQPLGQIRYVRRVFMLVPLLYLVAGAVAWLSPPVAIACFVLIPMAYLAPSRDTRHLTSMPRRT